MATNESVRPRVDKYVVDQALQYIQASGHRRPEAIAAAIASIRQRDVGWIEVFTDGHGITQAVAGPKLMALCRQLLEDLPPP